MKSNVVISTKFFEAFINLPRDIQNKTVSFFEKLLKEQKSSGLNIEKLYKVDDKQIYSARIDKSYRCILYKDAMEILHLLWVDNHDDAYNWIEDKENRFKIPIWASVYSNEFYENQGIDAQSRNNLFARISTKELQSLGVPLKDMRLIRNVKNYQAFVELKKILPENVYAKLEAIAIGINVQEILKKDKETRRKLIGLIEEKVLKPGLESECLGIVYKEHLEDTRRMLENRKTSGEVMNFVEDALDRLIGWEMHDALNKCGILTLEDIIDQLREIAANTF
jgi:mRNA-degrading endonuclease RelE of RelBE toxin-antitoxin system